MDERDQGITRIDLHGEGEAQSQKPKYLASAALDQSRPMVPIV